MFVVFIYFDKKNRQRKECQIFIYVLNLVNGNPIHTESLIEAVFPLWKLRLLVD